MDEIDDYLHDSLNHIIYINKTDKFAVFDVVFYIHDHLNLSLINPLYLAPLNQKN